MVHRYSCIFTLIHLKSLENNCFNKVKSHRKVQNNDSIILNHAHNSLLWESKAATNKKAPTECLQNKIFKKKKNESQIPRSTTMVPLEINMFSFVTGSSERL